MPWVRELGALTTSFVLHGLKSTGFRRRIWVYIPVGRWGDVERKRNEQGQFADTVTEADLLACFDAADAPVLTATEIANELPIGRRGVTHRLEQLRERGLVGSKEAGARAVVWWRADSVDDGERERSPPRETA